MHYYQISYYLIFVVFSLENITEMPIFSGTLKKIIYVTLQTKSQWQRPCS